MKDDEIADERVTLVAGKRPPAVGDTIKLKAANKNVEGIVVRRGAVVTASSGGKPFDKTTKFDAAIDAEAITVVAVAAKEAGGPPEYIRLLYQDGDKQTSLSEAVIPRVQLPKGTPITFQYNGNTVTLVTDKKPKPKKDAPALAVDKVIKKTKSIEPLLAALRSLPELAASLAAASKIVTQLATAAEEWPMTDAAGRGEVINALSHIE